VEESELLSSKPLAGVKEESMGSWGTGIKQDDLVCDVISLFKERLKDGASIEDATQASIGNFSASLDDTDDAPLVWIALADVQWSYGDLDKEILDRVKSDFENGYGLDRWREASEELLRKRQGVIKRFIEKISVPNAKPKKRPKRISRPPKFTKGDCLAIQLSNGQFGAGLVLAEDHSNIEYGLNLIAVLDYMSKDRPSLRVFKKRRWLKLTHHDWTGRLDISWYQPLGFRKEKDRFEIVGNIKIRSSDPEQSDCYSPWQSLGRGIVLQREWDSGAR